MAVLRAKTDAFPRIFFKPRLVGEGAENLTKDADPAVVGRSREIRSQESEIFADHFMCHTAERINMDIVMLQPLGKMHPNDALSVQGRLCQFVPIRRHHVGVPHISQRKPMLAEPKRSQKPLEKPLRLVPVLGSSGTAVMYAVDADSHRPSTAFLPLEIAHTFFSCHFYPFSLMV